MKKLLVAAAIMLAANTSMARDFATTQANSALGEGNVITLNKENTFNLSGHEVKVGDYFPSMILMDESLANFDTSKNAGKVRVYNVLASVDTPVCVQQVKDLSQYIAQHNEELAGIEMLAISADTAFAQMRFRQQENLEKNFLFLSDSINHEFGKKTGVQIRELGLLARSIIVVDKNNKIIHIQRVPELTTIPDLEKAVSIAKSKV
ncbi:thiol peroxidase [Photobacterium sp. J15]|uniref:thiol peroxidase n=1 Tax=Photobacterium sp. J15 TaxID=265901 RepID=UPI0007E3B643|nr:thiol peroxidase [Photobacterium sp. J15]